MTAQLEAFTLHEREMVFTAIRAQGAGGQNVNKVSSAVHLRFDVLGSSLPDGIKARLLALSDHRITRDGVVVIKAQSTRSQELNRQDALRRLYAMVESVAFLARPRRASTPTRASKLRRLEGKKIRSQTKADRRSLDP
jgi:ribosome-associated protein